MFTVVLLLSALAPSQTPEVPTVRPIEVREDRVRQLVKERSFGNVSVLTVRGELKGSAVTQAAKFGNLKVTEANDDTGADLISKDDFFSKTNRPEMKSIDKYERQEDRLPFDIRLKTTARIAKKISLKGSIDLLIGGKRANADFPKLRSLAGTELKHVELAALGIKIKLVKVEKSAIEYTIDGNQGPIDEVVLLDKSGKKIESTAGTFSVGKGPVIHQNNFAQEIGADSTLRIVLLKDAKTVTVPIAFANLELP